MKVIIAGSRTIKNYADVEEAVAASGFPVYSVVSGGANGVDKLGERWAKEHGVELDVFPADWGRYGKRAGFLRNKEMAENADALIAVWDGKSAGTRHMINIAGAQGLSVYIHAVHLPPAPATSRKQLRRAT